MSEFVFFFERDCFGVRIEMNITSPEPPPPMAWKTQKRNEKGPLFYRQTLLGTQQMRLK